MPLLILLGWAILGLLGAVVAMWLNIALIMSVVVKGIAARAVFGLYGIAYAYSIHGIYKRKIEGWWAALFLASFGSVSTLISHLRTDPIQFYREFVKNGLCHKQTTGFTLCGVAPIVAFAFLAFVVYCHKYFVKISDGLNP